MTIDRRTFLAQGALLVLGSRVPIAEALPEAGPEPPPPPAPQLVRAAAIWADTGAWACLDFYADDG